MQAIKRTLLVGAGVVTLGVGSLGVASAATTNTTSSNSPDSTLVDKIASTFNLDKTKVQAVFDQNRAEHRQDMQTKRADALKQAVTDGKVTQAQADYITKAWADIDALMPTDGSKPSDSQRQAIKTKMQALRAWEKQQNLDLRKVVGLGGPRGHHGFGGEVDADTSSSSSTSSTSTN